MVGARPPGVGVPAGEEGRQLRGADPRVVVGLPALVDAAVAAQPLADHGELPVGELEQAGGQREPAVEVGGVLLGDRALVADVVLELRPRVLQHRAHLHLRPARIARTVDLGLEPTSRCRLA